LCGFVSIIEKIPRSPEIEVLKKMADKINHRGPDDEGYFVDKNVGFFHKRLSIIDLEHGHQPMTSNQNTIIFNGEIYNYVELKETLIKKGVTFKTDSDTEVILKMYEVYGEGCVELLNGMFAFLIFDKANSKIIVARDHFGIKPLYFYRGGEQFIFASEIKSILAYPDVKASPNYNCIQEYLTFQFVLGEKTLYKGIHKVLPGHFLVIDSKSLDIREVKYWVPDFNVDNNHTEIYFKEKLKELLNDTIKKQLRSDVPLGTYLSGGMDSSIVSILAAKYLNNPIRTFTGAFREGDDFDETRYAKEVTQKINAEAFEIYPTEMDFIESLPKLVYHMDEPVAGPGVFPQYMVSKLAKENVTVVLGGQGGDEIFGGYARYVIAYLEQVLKGAIFETNDEGEHIVSLSSILPNLPHLHKYIPMMTDFWKKGAFKPADARYFDLIDRSDGSLQYYSPDFQREFNRAEIFSHFQEIFNHPDTKSYFNKMTHFDMFSSLPGLLHVEDRVSMAVSLESRVPLLDRRIVDLVSSMPPAMKFKGGEMKYFLKQAVGEVLPSNILNRKDKMGFPVPLHKWAKNNTQDFIRDTLFSQSSRGRGIFDLTKVDELIKSEKPFGRALWGILSLELWFSTFIDN
jgi:asparagine synthase (glutamine-hydrolysing)